MILTPLPATGFASKPWKNGLGTTHDVFLFPKGADHDTFDLRCALSPIDQKNLFSAFPGVERVITLVDGAGLELQFQAHLVRLSRYQPYRFDSGLAPEGQPVGGPATVINVMARKGIWDIRSCTVMSECDHSIGANELGLVFGLDDLVIGSGQTNVDLPAGDALLVSGAGSVQIRPKKSGSFLYAHLVAANA
ncbi:MAG: HutD family protein [Albidovulum sp.]